MGNRSLQKTHLLASEEFIGKVVFIETGRYAEVMLITREEMRVDDRGLIHGGFTFGLADYAAMVAVNDPFVVLVSSNEKFLKPVVCGDRLRAKAEIVETKGRRKKVWCEIFNQEEEKVFEGDFLCITLDKHVLETRRG